jgi:hypothetical protein
VREGIVLEPLGGFIVKLASLMIIQLLLIYQIIRTLSLAQIIFLNREMWANGEVMF